MSIHASAIIAPGARLDPTVEVGPWSIIDEGVSLGPQCVVGPYVYITGQTSIGQGNRFYAGCVIGEAPQDLKYRGEPSGLRIGDNNVFREHVTVHRSTIQGEETLIGSHCLLMAGCHVAHNCRLGDYVIMANGALLGGYVSLGDRAFVSGNCLVHQFCRVGALALMQGGSAISKDLPPFTVARGDNGMCGLNRVGLSRAGVPAAEKLELKQLYRHLFRNGSKLREAVATARDLFESPSSRLMLDFVASSKRGICADKGVREDTAPQQAIPDEQV